MKMRKVVTVILALVIIMTTFAVPVHADTADTKVADWHTDQFRKMYARMKNAEEWQELDEEVRKQINNYALVETKEKGESILILRTIDLEVRVKKQAEEDEDNIIGRLIDLLSSREFHTYLLLSKFAEYDGIRVGKNEKGIYTVFKTDIPTIPE